MNADAKVLFHFDGVPHLLSSNVVPKSCTPNAELRPFTLPDGSVIHKMFTTAIIEPFGTATIPFYTNWKASQVPLDCFNHRDNMSQCPMEQERKRAAEERAQCRTQ